MNVHFLFLILGAGRRLVGPGWSYDVANISFATDGSVIDVAASVDRNGSHSRISDLEIVRL
jgi:hypothetical protein